MSFEQFIQFVLAEWAQHLFWGTVGILLIGSGIVYLLSECLESIIKATRGR